MAGPINGSRGATPAPKKVVVPSVQGHIQNPPTTPKVPPAKLPARPSQVPADQPGIAGISGTPNIPAGTTVKTGLDPSPKPVGTKTPKAPPPVDTSMQDPSHWTVNDHRKFLRSKGFNVDAHGAYTARLHAAIKAEQQGKDPKTWNVQNPIVPKGSKGPGLGGAVKGVVALGKKGNATPAPGSNVPGAPTNSGDQTPDPNVPGQLSPDLLQALSAKFAKEFGGASDASAALRAPTFDPAQYAKNQAAAQFGPVIAQLTQNANMYQGAEKGAVNNVASDYAPVAAAASKAAGVDQAMAAANVADMNQTNAATLATPGLTGAAAYGAAAAGNIASGLAGKLGVDQGAADQARIVDAANTEALAKQGVRATNQTNLANTRTQLLAQQAAKANTYNTDLTDAQSRKQSELGNFINEKGALQNQQVLSEQSIPDILQRYSNLNTSQQGAAINKFNLGLQTRAANDAHARSVSEIMSSNVDLKSKQQQLLQLTRQTSSNGIPRLTPWKSVPADVRLSLIGTFHDRGSMQRLSPQQAYTQLKNDLKNTGGYTHLGSGNTPNTPAASVAQYIKDKFLKTNPNWYFDKKTDTFKKR